MCAKSIPFFFFQLGFTESNFYRIVGSIFEGELDHKKQNFLSLFCEKPHDLLGLNFSAN